LWIPADVSDPFWAFYPSVSFEKKLLLPEMGWQIATSSLSSPVNEAAWRLELDGSGVTSDGVASLLTRIDQVNIRSGTYLPNLALETSPAPALREYRSSVQRLTGALFAFSLPVFGLVLYFLGLVSGLARSLFSAVAAPPACGLPASISSSGASLAPWPWVRACCWDAS
jgi:hypothetical protein